MRRARGVADSSPAGAGRREISVAEDEGARQGHLRLGAGKEARPTALGSLEGSGSSALDKNKPRGSTAIPGDPADKSGTVDASADECRDRGDEELDAVEKLLEAALRSFRSSELDRGEHGEGLGADEGAGHEAFGVGVTRI